MTTKLLYFAWVREKIGKAEELVDLPQSVETVAQLVDWLKTRGQEYENAFARADIIRTAINQTHVGADAAIADAREIAFFPPVTGG